MAGRRGMGALGFQFVSPEAAQAWVHDYYNNLLQQPNKLADYPSNPNIAMVSDFMCAPTDEEAEAKADGWTFFLFALAYYGRHGVDAPGRCNMWDEYQELARETEGAAGATAGSSARRRRSARSSASSRRADVDQVILLNQAGKTTHEDICARSSCSPRR